MLESEKDKLGQTAFEAYVNSVGGLTYDNRPIPGWNDSRMTQKVRDGWIAAAIAIWEILLSRQEHTES